MKKANSTNFIHFNMQITVSDAGKGYWNEPRKVENIEFDIPTALFSETLFGSMVATKLENMQVEFETTKKLFYDAQALAEAEDK